MSSELLLVRTIEFMSAFLSSEDVLAVFRVSKLCQKSKDCIREVHTKHVDVLNRKFPGVAILSIRQTSLNANHWASLSSCNIVQLFFNDIDLRNIDFGGSIDCPKLDTVRLLRINRVRCLSDFISRWICELFPQLSTLIMENVIVIRKNELKPRLPNLQHLKRLTISACYSLEGIVELQEHLGCLEGLSLSKCSRLLGLSISSGQLQRLISCDLSWSGIDSTTLVSVIDSSPALLYLYAAGCSRLRNTLAINHKKLEILDLHCCTGLRSLTCVCPNMILIDIGQCVSLASLTLQSTTLRDLNIELLHNLTSLDLQCPNLNTFYKFSGQRFERLRDT